jgi:hypothetical protein
MHDDGSRDLEAVLARAQAAVADLAKNFEESAVVDLDRCAGFLKAAREDPDERVANVKEIYGIAHNLKGQGSSFGYPLITRIGQSLCQLTRPDRNFSDSDLGIVQAHLDAIRLILAKEIKGDGGDIGSKLAARLEALADQAHI